MCNVVVVFSSFSSFLDLQATFFYFKINFQKSSLILDMCLCKDVNVKNKKKNNITNMNNVCHLIKINTKNKAFHLLFLRENVFRYFVFICEFFRFCLHGAGKSAIFFLG